LGQRFCKISSVRAAGCLYDSILGHALLIAMDGYSRSFVLRTKRKIVDHADQLASDLDVAVIAAFTRFLANICVHDDDIDTDMEDFVLELVTSVVSVSENGIEFRERAWDQMFDAIHRARLARVPHPSARIDIHMVDDVAFKRKFVFRRDDLPRLVQGLRIPASNRTRERYVFTGSEGLLILLYRLSHMDALSEMEFLFNRSEAAISAIFNWMLSYLVDQWSDLLFFSTRRLTVAKLHELSDYLHFKLGCPVRGIIGFLDGTMREVAKPHPADRDNDIQRSAFSGYKHIHCLKYQCFVTLDGIIAHSYGPIFGRHNDKFLVNESDVASLMCALTQCWPADASDPHDRPRLFADAGYVSGPYIMATFADPSTGSEMHFNRVMSGFRVAVEWGFKDVVQKWKLLNNVAIQRVLNSPIGYMYLVAILLTNCYTCLCGGQTCHYTRVLPPTLEEYLVL